jgi:hypothetical protein
MTLDFFLFFFRILYSNNIKQIKKVHVENLPLTSQLYLQNNKIGWIEDGAFNHISSIYYM